MILDWERGFFYGMLYGLLLIIVGLFKNDGFKLKFTNL